MFKKRIFTKFFERIFDFINHIIMTVIIKKPITFIIFGTEKITQHVDVTSHTRRQKICKIVKIMKKLIFYTTAYNTT